MDENDESLTTMVILPSYVLYYSPQLGKGFIGRCKDGPLSTGERIAEAGSLNGRAQGRKVVGAAGNLAAENTRK